MRTTTNHQRPPKTSYPRVKLKIAQYEQGRPMMLLLFGDFSYSPIVFLNSDGMDKGKATGQNAERIQSTSLRGAVGRNMKYERRFVDISRIRRR